VGQREDAGYDHDGVDVSVGVGVGAVVAVCPQVVFRSAKYTNLVNQYASRLPVQQSLRTREVCGC